MSIDCQIEIEECRKLDSMKIKKEEFPELEIEIVRWSGTGLTGKYAYWVELKFKLPVPSELQEMVGNEEVLKEMIVVCEKESETLEVIGDVLSLKV